MRTRTALKKDRQISDSNPVCLGHQTSAGSSPVQCVNAFWEGDNVVIVVRHDDGKVERRIDRASYTCFVKADDLDERNERKLRDLKFVRGMKREGDWWRITWNNWKMMRKACDTGGAFEAAGIQTYEADVNPVRRWLTDHNVHIKRPRRCYIDLEVDSRKTFLQMRAGGARVLSWALCDDEGEVVFGVLENETDDDEKILLEDLWDELLEYDQVCAWNLDGFDGPVLKERTKRLGIVIEPRRWLWLDHMGVYRRFNISASESGDEKDSMALNRVAQAVLGRGKFDFDAKTVYEEWAAGGERRERLIDYNIEDVVLMRDIEERTGYLELHYTVCEACNTLPDSRGTNPTNFVEGYVLKLGLEHGLHFKTMYGYGMNDRFAGAYVMPPKRVGLLRGVHVCDFAGLYPSIILSWNMSPETITDIVIKESQLDKPSYLRHSPVKEIPIPDGHCAAPITEKVFRCDKQGLVPIALKHLLELRSTWKKRKADAPANSQEWKEADRRSSAYKIAANSFYGVMGSPFSRFFVRDVAESVTQGGKWLLTETMKAAEDEGFEPVYGDTDSLFIGNCTNEQFANFVERCNTELYPRLLKERKAYGNHIKLGYEKKFKTLVMVSKKRYAGSFEHYEGTAVTDYAVEIKGLEYKRGDTLKLARSMQYTLIKMLLHHEYEDTDDYITFVKMWRWRILEGDLDLVDVRMSKTLTRDVRLYHRKEKKDGGLSALPIHVEVALQLGERGEDITEGTRIEYVVIDGRTPQQAIPASDYDGHVDRYYLWEKLVFPPSQRILEATFPAIRWKEYMKVRPGSRRGRSYDIEGQGTLF